MNITALDEACQGVWSTSLKRCSCTVCRWLYLQITTEQVLQVSCSAQPSFCVNGLLFSLHKLQNLWCLVECANTLQVRQLTLTHSYYAPWWGALFRLPHISGKTHRQTTLGFYSSGSCLSHGMQCLLEQCWSCFSRPCQDCCCLNLLLITTAWHQPMYWPPLLSNN